MLQEILNGSNNRLKYMELELDYQISIRKYTGCSRTLPRCILGLSVMQEAKSSEVESIFLILATFSLITKSCPSKAKYSLLIRDQCSKQVLLLSSIAYIRFCKYID